MSVPSVNYINTVVRWAYGEINLSRIHMRPDQRFRARLAMECYHLWMEHKSVNIRKMVQRIAQRDYAILLENAKLGQAEAIEIVEALNIRRDPKTGAISPRRETEISNDVYTVNALAGRLSVAKKHIQKAMYEDNIEWLMQYGRKNGNVAAIKEAQRNLEKINNDFKEDDNPQEQMPNTNINITSDVSIIKKDRKTMTDEEREQMRKKYGLTQKEYAIQLEEINGVWKQPDADEPEQDIFVENEHE